MGDGHGTQFHGNPLIDRGVIWFGTDQGFSGQRGSLFGIDMGSGSLGSHTRLDPGMPSDLQRYKKSLLGVMLDDRLVSITMETGNLAWTVASRWQYDPDLITYEDLRTPRLASSCVVTGDRACYAGRDGVLRGLDAGSGRLVWSTDLDAQITTQPCLVDGEVVVGTEHFKLVFCDAQSGEVTRTQELPAIAMETMSHRDGRLYILAGYEDANPLYLMCVGAATGDVNWKQIVPEEPADQYWYVPRLHFWRGAVLAGTTHGLLVAYQAQTGAEVWRHQLEGPLRGIGSTDQSLFVGNLDGILFALRPGPASAE